MKHPPPTLFEHAAAACFAATQRTHADASIVSRRGEKVVSLTCGLRDGKPVVYESQEREDLPDTGTTPSQDLENALRGWFPF
jgi:hypothetical protein